MCIRDSLTAVQIAAAAFSIAVGAYVIGLAAYGGDRPLSSYVVGSVLALIGAAMLYGVVKIRITFRWRPEPEDVAGA